LKSLAKELNIPIIVLSQLNRSVETRGGLKKPILSDLRESGAIEQDADMVLFIYRPEYYKIDMMEDQTSSKGKAELIVAKHRNGALADIKMRFIAEFAQFTDDDEFDFNVSESMNPNEKFDENGQRSITMQSKMNDDVGDEGNLPDNLSDDGLPDKSPF
jgi:replicative DNA helicase